MVLEEPSEFYKWQKQAVRASDQALHLHAKSSYFRLWALVTQAGSFVLRTHAVIKRTQHKYSSRSAVAELWPQLQTPRHVKTPGLFWVWNGCGPRLLPACPAPGIPSIFTVLFPPLVVRPAPPHGLPSSGLHTYSGDLRVVRACVASSNWTVTSSQWPSVWPTGP